MTQFTHLNIHAHVTVPSGIDVEQVRRALEKAERGCLISNSLKATIQLEPVVDLVGEPVEALVGVTQ